MRLKASLTLAGLGLLLLLSLGLNAYWIKLSYPLTASDVAIHNANALLWHRVLNHSEPLAPYAFFQGRFADLPGIITVAPLNIYPPLVYLLTALLTWGTTPWPQYAALALQGFTLLFILGLWGCARELWGEKAAWAAVLLGGSSPLFLSYSRIYFLDTASAALVLATLYFWLASRGFTRPGYSIGFGLSLGLGCLTRSNFIYYSGALVLLSLVQLARPLLAQPHNRTYTRAALLSLAALAPLSAWLFLNFKPLWTPAAYLLSLAGGYTALGGIMLGLKRWRSQRPEAAAFVNLLLSLSLALALAAPWYLSACGRLMSKYAAWLGGARVAALGYYLDAGLNACYPALVLLLASACYYFRNPQARARSLPLWLGLGVSCAALATYNDCNDRYLLPALPYLILGLCGVLETLRGKLVLPSWILIVLISLWQLSGWLWVRGLPPSPAWTSYKVYNTGFRYPPGTWLKATPLVSALPREGAFPIPAVLQTIQRLKGQQPCAVAMVDEQRSPIPIEKDYFNYWAYFYRLPYIFGNAPREQLGNLLALPRERPGGPEFSFLLYNTSNPGTLDRWQHDIAATIGWRLKLLQRYAFAEGQYFYLYALK